MGEMSEQVKGTMANYKDMSEMDNPINGPYETWKDITKDKYPKIR